MFENLIANIKENPTILLVTLGLTVLAFFFLYFMGGDSIVFFRGKRVKDEPDAAKKILPDVQRFASANGYKMVTNVTVAHKGDTGHFDAVVVGTFGMLGVNACGLGGEIYGSAKEEEWLQVFEGERSHFPNPVDANVKNMGILRSALAERGVKVKEAASLTVFTQKGKKIELNLANTLPFATVDSLRADLDVAKFKADNQTDIDAVCTAIEELNNPA